MKEHTMTEDYAPILEQIRDLPCRCCLQKTLQAHVQRGFAIANDAIYVDCRNPACALYYVTHRINEWLTFDVRVWHTDEDPAWQNVIVEAATASAATDPMCNLRTLVETFIVEREAPIADIVLRDFRERYRGTLPYQRRSFCQEWLRLYTGVAS
jgi:hypothetical protein